MITIHNLHLRPGNRTHARTHAHTHARTHAGMKDLPTSPLTDWKGNKNWVPTDKANPCAHPNSRFTTPLHQCPVLDGAWDSAEGVRHTYVMPRFVVLVFPRPLIRLKSLPRLAPANVLHRVVPLTCSVVSVRIYCTRNLIL